MNSEEQIAPPQGVAAVNTTEGAAPTEGRGRRHRRRNRHRNRKRRRHRKPGDHPPAFTPTPTHPAEEDRPPVTEGTQLHQARQNHSTYDRDLHHRGRGGTGYGYRRDVTQPESELRGDQLPTNILPSYEQVLKRAGVWRDATPGESPEAEPEAQSTE